MREENVSVNDVKLHLGSGAIEIDIEDSLRTKTRLVVSNPKEFTEMCRILARLSPEETKP